MTNAIASDASFAGLDVSDLTAAIATSGHVPTDVADRILALGYDRALIERAEENGQRARLAEDQRLLVLVRIRQVGIERVAKALAADAEALQLVRESHATRPSEVLALLLDSFD